MTRVKCKVRLSNGQDRIVDATNFSVSPAGDLIFFGQNRLSALCALAAKQWEHVEKIDVLEPANG